MNGLNQSYIPSAMVQAFFVLRLFFSKKDLSAYSLRRNVMAVIEFRSQKLEYKKGLDSDS